MTRIEHINYINAPAATVYEALTTQKGLGEVWTRELKVTPETGFVNEFDFDDGYSTKMKITGLVPGTKVAWECIASDPEWVGTTISFDMAEKNGVTAVTLRHMNWKELTEFYRWCNYNWGFFLYSLKQYCEEGKGTPFQERKF